jgi:FkbM family methyltransferase
MTPSLAQKKIARFTSVLTAIMRHPLHRAHPVRAVWRATRLIMASALTPTRHIAIPYIDDTVLYWPMGASSVMLCARFGLGEYTDMAFCLHALRPDDLFCDVGANAGVYTILAAGAVGSRVVSIEPIPRTFDLLMANVYANGVAHLVDGRRNGMGAEPGTLHFTSSLWSLNHVVAPETPDSIAVGVVTLDAVLDRRVPQIIKIDVEGFEAKVLQGASGTLNDPRLLAILIEVTEQLERYGDAKPGIASILEHAGFTGPFWYQPNTRSLVDAREPGPTRYNQIFVRDKSLIEARLRSASEYTIHGTKV